MKRGNWERRAMVMGMGGLESCVQKDNRNVLMAMKRNGYMLL